MRISGLGFAAVSLAAAPTYTSQLPYPHPVIHFTGLNGVSGLGVAQILDQATVESIGAAIQQQEGYYPGSLAYTNNNPGNLIYASQTGATKGDGGFAKFLTYADGLQALYNQIQLYASRGMTIQDMMNVYAPAGQGKNDPVLYAQVVSAAVGATPDTALTDIGQVYPSDNPMNISPSSGQIDAGVFAGVILVGLVGILVLSPSN